MPSQEGWEEVADYAIEWAARKAVAAGAAAPAKTT
jgi:hypothetical protein